MKVRDNESVESVQKVFHQNSCVSVTVGHGRSCTKLVLVGQQMRFEVPFGGGHELAHGQRAEIRFVSRVGADVVDERGHAFVVALANGAL